MLVPRAGKPGNTDLCTSKGYNFTSLQDISPFLEPAGSGITSLWARTAALKYDCHVVVGYPEKVDVSGKWPTGPEYYNTAIIVDGEGQTVANVRKSFLYMIDESWALESKDGFFHDDIPGLGSTVVGICTVSYRSNSCVLARD